MKKIVLLTILIALAISCGEGSRDKKGASTGNTDPGDSKELSDGVNAGNSRELPLGKDTGSSTGLSEGSTPAEGTELPSGAILIARDIVTEVVIRPDPEGDPWEVEKVAGYNGTALIDGIFSRIYDGSLTVFDYHSGEPLSPSDVKKIEGEFKNDRTKIGKLSFTEDWYWFPEDNRVEKHARSVTFGYELYNNVGKVYAYRAAFRADLQ